MVCVDFKTLCSDICLYFSRICKKIYTYNFYSFNKSDFLIGGILNIIFGMFIISNIVCLIYSFIHSTDNEEGTKKYENDPAFQILYLIAFETHLFFEIICPLYIKGMKLKDSLYLTFRIFLIPNSSSIL